MVRARLIVFCWTDCGTCKMVDEFRGRYSVEGCLYVRTYVLLLGSEDRWLRV